MFPFRKKKDKTPKPKPAPLQAEKDYYIENGYYVFTAHYLTKRGYCCGNKCRHCPYGEQKK